MMIPILRDFYMLSPETISELNQAFQSEPGGFLVVDSGRPKFAILDFETYRKFKGTGVVPKSSKEKILVTGGAGYIGSHVCRVLYHQGYEVVAYDNLSTGLAARVKDFKLIEADLGDAEALDRVFAEEKIDAVMHFAASIESEESVLNPSKYFQNNVVNGLHLLDAMVRHKVDKIVFSSSAAVYGNSDEAVISEDSPCRPTNPYGESKLMFEQMLKWYEQSYGIRSVSLRYFNAAGAAPEWNLGFRHLGRETHLIPRVLNVALGKSPEIEVYGQDYPTPDGTCVRDYIHVLDLADAHVLALKKLKQSNGAYVYNVGTGKGHTVLEVIDEAVEVTGRMIPMKFAERRAGDPYRLVADCGRMQTEFNWQSRHDLRSIIETTWTWQKIR